jgi:hypothetical protein
MPPSVRAEKVRLLRPPPLEPSEGISAEAMARAPDRLFYAPRRKPRGFEREASFTAVPPMTRPAD